LTDVYQPGLVAAPNIGLLETTSGDRIGGRQPGLSEEALRTACTAELRQTKRI
jgi:hypothetical protein